MKIVKFKQLLFRKIVRIWIFIKRESSETKEMLIVFKQLLDHKLKDIENPTKKDVKESLHQLKDLGKITTLLPIFMLPGASIILVIILKIEKKYNIKILPSRSFS